MCFLLVFKNMKLFLFICKQVIILLPLLLKYSELLRILKRDGWLEIRQSGSHVIMQHPQRSTQLTVPNHGTKEIGKGLQQKILKQAGIKRKGI